LSQHGEQEGKSKKQNHAGKGETERRGCTLVQGVGFRPEMNGEIIKTILPLKKAIEEKREEV